MKRRSKVSGLVLGMVASAAIVAYGATATSFKVNNVSVTGRISYYDSNDYNPLTADSVTATTTATSVMDSITATATIYYYKGNTQYSVKESNTEPDARTSSVTAKASSLGVGYKGEGTHSAEHNNDSKSGTTTIRW